MSNIAYIEQRSLKTFQEIESCVGAGADLIAACSAAGVSDITYFKWFKKYGDTPRKISARQQQLEQENSQLKKTIAELELDISFLRDCLEILIPKSPRRQG